MGTTWRKATDEQMTGLRTLVDQQFPEIVDSGATYSLLLATNPDVPPIKAFGLGAVATVKINPPRLRVDGAPDFQVQVDANGWTDKSDTDREAILYSVLRRVQVRQEVAEDDSGQTAVWSRDENGRPKLRINPPDFLAAGFWDAVERYGEDAPEAKAMKSAGAVIKDLIRARRHQSQTNGEQS